MGRLITYRKDVIHANPYVKYMVGLLGSWGVFFLLFTWLEWFQNWNTYGTPFVGCFSALVYIYSALMAIATVVALVVDRKKIVGHCKHVYSFTKRQLKSLWANKLSAVYVLIFAVVLLIQCFFAYKYQINEWSYDDYDYVVSSQDTLSHDVLANTSIITGQQQVMLEKRAVSSWTTYIAYLARTSGFDVTTISHTILPVVLLLVAYLVYYYIASLLFKGREDRWIFMDILAVSFMFGLYSHYSLTFRLLCTIWQGKAAFFAIAVPFLIAYFIQLYSASTRESVMPVVAVSMGATSLSAMSMVVIGMVVVLCWVIMSIHNRKPANPVYLIAGLIGPIYQVVFYYMVCLLLEDMQGGWPQHFQRSRENSWWYKWFG